MAASLNAIDQRSTQVDTTGLAAGSYTANATIIDPRGPKKANVANCARKLLHQRTAKESPAGYLLCQSDLG